MSRRLEWSLLGGYSEILDPQVSGGKEKAYYGQTGINYQFSASLIGELSYGYYNRDSDTDGNDLRENTVSVSVRKEF